MIAYVTIQSRRLCKRQRCRREVANLDLLKPFSPGRIRSRERGSGERGMNKRQEYQKALLTL